MKILIAYDGSPCADEAIEDLQRAALPDDVEAVVLSVADLLIPPHNGRVSTPVHITTLIGEARAESATMMDAAKARAQGAAAKVRAAFPTWQVEAKHIADSPAWGIVLEAEAMKADLIVTGSHGHSALGRLVLGSVSQSVLTHAPCSVRIGRGGRTTPHQPLRILVGVDGSPESEMAVQAAAARVWPAGTDIRLLMVVEPSLLASVKRFATAKQPTPVMDASTVAADVDVDIATGVADDVAADDLEAEHAILNFLVRQRAHFGHKAGVNVTKALWPGNPKQVLVEEAERWGADAIFIGSRGLNGWERLLLGSVSAAVAARAHCPVEVIRAS